MRVLDIASKDIRQIMRDWKSALFLIIMPVLFTVFFGIVFGPTISSDASKKDARLPVGWINQDATSQASASLQALLNQSSVIRLVPMDGEAAGQASELVGKGDYAAVVRVPSGYSQSLFAGQPANLEVIADQTTSSGRTAVTAIDTMTGRLLGAVESANIATETYQEQVGFASAEDAQVYFQQTFQQASQAWNDPSLTVSVGQASTTSGGDGEAVKVTGFTQSSAGMIVQFAIFGLINAAMVLVLERKTRCMQRLLTTPAKGLEVIGGHVLAMFLIVFIQELILVLLGQFVFGVDYLRQPLAILVMVVLLAFWAASLGLLIGALAKSEDQVVVLSLIAMFVFSALGGAWFPLDVAGRAFSAVGHALPSAWAMDGFQNIVLRGLGFNSVLLPAGILLAYALVFFGLALWRFKFE